MLRCVGQGWSWGQVGLGWAARGGAERGWAGHGWVGLLRGADSVSSVIRHFSPLMCVPKGVNSGKGVQGGGAHTHPGVFVCPRFLEYPWTDRAIDMAIVAACLEF